MLLKYTFNKITTFLTLKGRIFQGIKRKKPAGMEPAIFTFFTTLPSTAVLLHAAVQVYNRDWQLFKILFWRKHFSQFFALEILYTVL